MNAPLPLNLVPAPTVPAPMNAAQIAAARHAAKLLHASGAIWAIRLPDGETLGNAQLAEPEQPQRARARNFRQYGYQAMIDALAAGDSISIPVPAELAADPKGIASFAATVAAGCARKHGKGACMTARSSDGSSIDVVRVS